MTDRSQPIGSAIDHGRRSMSVPRGLMPAVLAVHAGDPPVPAETASMLERAGLMSNGRLDPLATRLVGIMINPSVVLTIEMNSKPSPQLATIWARPSNAVLGTTDDRHRFHLLQIEPGLLPFHLAQVTGLTPRSPQAVGGGCTIPTATLTAAETLARSNPSDARRALIAAGVTTTWADRVTKALAHRRALWTVDSVWVGSGTGRTESRLCILDAGLAGYWRLVEDAHRITLNATDFDDVIKRFAALLPDRRAH